MKIAMIGQKGIPAKYGGVEAHVDELSHRLAERGFSITAYSRKWYTKMDDNTHNGVYVKHVGSLQSKHMDTITYSFFATIDAVFNKYDIIHYHGVGPALLSWIPRVFSPWSTVITTFHSIDRYHQKWNGFAKFVLRMGEWAACLFSHETITVSQSLKKYCKNEFKADTTYIPNGVTLLNEEIVSDNLISEFGLEKNRYLVMISRLVPHKGVHLLMEAFNNLKIKHADDPDFKDLKLAIVGGSVYTNDYVQVLLQQASSLSDVVFTDFQSGETLGQLRANALALVNPSLNEGLPITVLEAMGCGKPVLVSNIAEHLELTHDNRAVFIENSVEALEEKIYEFMKLEALEMYELGRQNKRKVAQEYSWDIVVPQIEKLYKKQSSKNKSFLKTLIVKA